MGCRHYQGVPRYDEKLEAVKPLPGKTTLSTLLIITLAAGCSGIKTYPNEGLKNLTVRAKTSSASSLESIRTSVDVYGLDNSCNPVYEGTVQLDKPSVEIGIPPGRTSYLAFVFAGSSCLAGSKTMTTYETLFNPRKGRSYIIDASYEEDVYHVEIREVRKGKGKTSGRLIERKTLDSCKPGK